MPILLVSLVGWANARHADPASAQEDVPLLWSSSEAIAAPELDGCESLPEEWDGPVFSGLFGYDIWRGYPDGGWANYGLHSGFNVGTPLPWISERTKIGGHFGSTMGVYNWSGTDYRMTNQEQATTQGFVTYGLFRNADSDSDISWAIAQDWMIANNYSVFNEDVAVYQWRGLVGFTLTEHVEIGLWGAGRGSSTTRNVSFFGEVTWQPQNQLNVFLHHKWLGSGADTWFWFGIPERNRLDGDGSLGDYVIGLYGTIPISPRVAPYMMANYMHPSAGPGAPAAREDMWNVYMGIALYWRPLARSATINGHRWSPKLPIANNGLMIVNASQTY